MLGKANILFTRSKAAAKRISSLVLAVFMLQVVAAGFCVTTASAAPVQQVSAMEHCMVGKMKMAEQMTSQMQGMDMSQGMTAHACSHCDMPDASLSLDKHVFSASDLTADFVVVALAATIDDVAVVAFADSPPDLLRPQTSLTTFNLNLRIRV